MRALLFSIMLLFGVVAANAVANCDSIISHGLRNIEVSQSSEAAIAAKYYNYCRKDWSSLSDEQIASVEVKIFGQGEGGGGFTRRQREERLSQFCTTSQDIAESNKTAYQRAEVFFQGAVSAWESCNNLNSKDIRIKPIISPDAKTVTMGIVYFAPTTSGILLYGIDAEGFECKVTTPDAPGTKIKYPLEIKNLNIQTICNRAAARKQTLNGQEYMVVPRGTISVKTASDPFQLFFAEEWDPGLPVKESEALRESLRRSEIPVGTVISSALNESEFFNPINPQYSKDKWILADGRALPSGSLYERLTGRKNAPDLRPEQGAYYVLDVRDSVRNSGEPVSSSMTALGAPGEWRWFASGRDIAGQRDNNDYEQDSDQFQTYIDGGVVTAQGRTLNWKQGRWGPWHPGSANVLGISLRKNSLYYYVKIN